MAKVNGPLFSQSAHGHFRRRLCFRRHSRGSIVTNYSRPTGAPSTAQSEHRAAVAALMGVWSTLTPSQQASWIPSAESLRIPPNLAFFSENWRRIKLGSFPIRLFEEPLSSLYSGLIISSDFSEGSGDRVYNAITSLYGTIKNANLSAAWGTYPGSLLLDGSNDRIDAASLGTLSPNSPYSISCDLTLRSASHSCYIFNVQNAANTSATFTSYIAAARTATFFWAVSSGNSLSKTTSSLVPLNQPCFITMTYDGSQTLAGINIYFDGVLQSVGATTGPGVCISASGTHCTGGRTFDNTRNLHANLRGVWLHNRDLSASEVAAMASTPPTPFHV